MVQNISTDTNSLNRLDNNISDEIEASATELPLFDNIIKSVDDITDKINLLALNTSMEAARAGDEQSGMKNISGQMSMLAQKTSQTAGEITDYLKNVQTDKKAVDDQVSDYKEEFEHNKELSRKIKESLDIIFDSIEKAHKMIHDAAGGESATGMNQSKIVSSGHKEATRILNLQVKQLKSLFGRFKQ